MKILFIFPREFPYDSRYVRENPCGGTEKATIFLGEALTKLGHEVQTVTTVDQIFDPHWPDVVITQHAHYFESFPDHTRKVWWCHHFSDQPVIIENVAYGRAFADVVVTLSQCQRKDFADNLKIDSVVIGHGIWLDEVLHQTDKDPYRLCYTSAPFRGLERIPELFARIREREPRATIAICSSHAMYGKPDEDQRYGELFELLKSQPGVELKGALNQTELYAEYARAGTFFYPNTWPETYCIALDEAIAHRCVPITTGLAALGERATSAGNTDNALLAQWDLRCDGLMMGWEEPRDWLAVAKDWEAVIIAFQVDMTTLHAPRPMLSRIEDYPLPLNFRIKSNERFLPIRFNVDTSTLKDD